MIKETALFIKHKLSIRNPQTLVILGSGLGNFADVLSNVETIDYKDIPNFPKSTVKGHKGQLVHGYIGDKEVICMNGRFHLYEGYAPQVIAQVIRIFKELGIKRLIVTNAAGSLKTTLLPGSLMLIKDHINLSGQNPLIGENDEDYGPRFSAMNQAYTLSLRQKVKKLALKKDITLSEGTYLMVLGPNFETSAEIRAFATLGADAVGMSTVPEVISAVHCGMEVLGISVITNYGAGLMNNTPSHQETVEQADKAATSLTTLLTSFIKEEN